MKFSIITCTKNSEQYVKNNIDSIIGQTFKDYEHIFVDGDSDDRTIEIINEYRSRSSNKVILITSPAKGIADAMNCGIQQAKGEYLIHLHSDDYLHDDLVLEDVAKFLEKNSNPDWIYSKELRVGSTGKPIAFFADKKIFRFGSRSIFSRYLLKYFDFIRHQSVFIKKSVFSRFGNFNESFSIAMDYEFWLRIKDKTSWIFFNRTVDCFRMHDGGTSTAPQTKTKMQLDEMLAAKLYMNWFEFYLLRFLFKVIAYSVAEIEKQRSLYRHFIKSQSHKLSQ